MNFYDEVYRQVMQIPKGKVATYGMIAERAGNPKAARAVGNALHVNPMQGVIPCHRVVNQSGATAKAFVFGGEDKQRELLENEGVTFLDDGRVDIKKHIWK